MNQPSEHAYDPRSAKASRPIERQDPPTDFKRPVVVINITIDDVLAERFLRVAERMVADERRREDL